MLIRFVYLRLRAYFHCYLIGKRGRRIVDTFLVETFVAETSFVSIDRFTDTGSSCIDRVEIAQFLDR